MITTLEELRTSMCMTHIKQQNEIAQRFNDIAAFLINRCAIEYKDDLYQFVDIEFYFYNKNHRDISVHPRQNEALTWYINDFGGIDLNFESSIEKVRVEKKGKVSYKYLLNDESYFGGILIRQLKDMTSEEILDGPWKVADLFRELDATSHSQSNPILVLHEHEKMTIKSSPRLNLLGARKDAAKKTHINLQNCFAEPYPDEQMLADALDEFNKENYRYTI